jgi:ribonuclease-3
MAEAEASGSGSNARDKLSQPAKDLLKNQQQLPELLRLADNVWLQVFTHRSYFARPTHIFEDPPDDLSPDNEM